MLGSGITSMCLVRISLCFQKDRIYFSNYFNFTACIANFFQLYSEIEIFHITPTRATMVQKSTKYVKYTVCFPMGNFSFICGMHE